MKICVTSEGNTLDSKIDARFGRCQYFVIVDTDTLQFEAIKNPNIDAMGGIGIQSAQLLSSKNVSAVITGSVGPNAFQTLNAAGIDIYTRVNGIVKEAIDAYKSKKLDKATSPNAGSKFGLGKWG